MSKVMREDIPELLESLYHEALTDDQTTEYDEDFNLLFGTKIWGYREVVLVCVLGRYLDSSYSPYNDFYSCHPRPLFENCIRNTLTELGIPHRKSGPLNIAKATKGLNEDWASRRREKEVADATVRCAKDISSMNDTELHSFTIALIKRFVIEAENAGRYILKIDNPALDPDCLFAAIRCMILGAPDNGNTPQRIVGLLMTRYYESIGSKFIVTGVNDRASVTSTTSKKPGDLQEEFPLGTVHKVYEVTVKPFDEARIRDSYDTLVQYSKEHEPLAEIIVLCRTEDCPEEYRTPSSPCLGKKVYNGVLYTYYNLFDRCYNLIVGMTSEARENFLQDLNIYVSSPNTDLDVKKQWCKCISLYLDLNSGRPGSESFITDD